MAQHIRRNNKNICAEEFVKFNLVLSVLFLFCGILNLVSGILGIHTDSVFKIVLTFVNSALNFLLAVVFFLKLKFEKNNSEK